MVAEDVIKPATSEWVRVFVFSPKKNGSLRFRTENQRLSTVVDKDTYLPLRVDLCFNLMGEEREECHLYDATSRYLYCPEMPSDVHEIFSDCCFRARNSRTSNIQKNM